MNRKTFENDGSLTLNISFSELLIIREALCVARGCSEQSLKIVSDSSKNSAFYIQQTAEYNALLSGLPS